MPIIERCTHGARTIAACRECKKIYHQHDHANRALYLWRAAKARAHKRGVPFTITQTDVLVPTHCPVLGIPLDSKDRDHAPSIDEIVQGLGYVPCNICVISGRANRIKSNATLADIQAIECYIRLRSLFALKGVPTSW